VTFRGYRDPSQLDVAIQEGFIHAFRERGRDSYDGSKEYRPFLLTIIRNYTIDQIRKARTEERYFVHIGDLGYETEHEHEALERLRVAEPEATPERETLQRELQSTLAAFVESLDEEDSQLVQLHLMGELTQQEMAEHLGESRNDIRKRIRLLRGKLLRHLKREGFIENLDAAQAMQSLAASVGVW